MAVYVSNFTNYDELRILLAEKMRRQAWWASSFGQWIGPNFVKKNNGVSAYESISPGGVRQKWTGAPIEVVNGFVSQGRTEMEIPVLNRLTGRTTFGNQQLFGKGEVNLYGFRTIKINQQRKSWTKPTGYEAQKVKHWRKDLMMNGASQLTQWYSDYFTEMILAGLLNGQSQDVTGATAAGGLGATAYSHPNFFVAGAGRVSWNSGTGTFTNTPLSAAYEADVASAIDGCATGLTYAFLKNLAVEASRLKIPPLISSKGNRFYAVWLKDAAFQQLLADADFQATLKSLHISSMDEHPLGNLGGIYVAGLAIFNDMKLWSARTNAIDSNVTAGTVEYGPTPTAAERNAGFTVGNTLTQLDTGAKAIGVLAGANMLTIGEGEKPEFYEQTEDFGLHYEMESRFIQSVVRNDVVDKLGTITGTAGKFYENTSSLVFCTNSPFALNY